MQFYLKTNSLKHPAVKASRMAKNAHIVGCIFMTLVIMNSCKQKAPSPIAPAAKVNSKNIPATVWKAPDTSAIPDGKAGELIRYGHRLIAYTAVYLGPQGSVAHISNGMNCQNCHLEGGSRIFGNNFASFITSYPRFVARSNKVEPAANRIVECFKRSLGGTPPDSNSKEMQAILAYMQWIGQGVKKGQKLFGNATEKLPFMDHAAEPLKGKIVYENKCKTCHGAYGEGLFAANKKSYTYPPLWGPHSYNDGAGMYRLGNLAGFVKNNMPFGTTWKDPQLSNEDAWNVAAFINSQPRTHRDQHHDWADLSKKPIDMPFGPYSDSFSEKQHKYGPFKPIADFHKAHDAKKSKAKI